MEISRYVRPNVRRLVAYAASEIPCRIKLDANESPVGPDRRTMARIGRLAAATALNRYPDPEGRALRGLLARGLRLSRRRILLGNGSDELISLLVTTFGGPVLVPEPTFSMYGIIARGLGERVVTVRLDRDFDLDAERMARAIRKHRPRLVFLSTPNNPTGNVFSRDRVLSVLDRTPGIVVVDEAYQPFSGAPGYLRELRRRPNLAVLRTLSKIGLAALRIGFLAASPELVSEVNKVRLPFNVNALSQAAAQAVLESGGMDGIVRGVVRERKRLADAMSKMPGVVVHPSEANFILFGVDDAERVHRGLLRRGILVRNLDGVIPGTLRVTVGRPAENKAFLQALKAVLG